MMQNRVRVNLLKMLSMRNCIKCLDLYRGHVCQPFSPMGWSEFQKINSLPRFNEMVRSAKKYYVSQPHPYGGGGGINYNKLLEIE